MKKILFILLTAAIVVGCSNNKETEPEIISGTINVTPAISLDGEPATKAGPTIPTGHQLRYILEVYKGSLLVIQKKQTSGTFNIRLLNGVSYDYLFWADYVPTGQIADEHYDTSSLTAVKIAGATYGGCDVSRDAFCGSIIGKTLEEAVAGVTLKRPFAKLMFENTTGLIAVESVVITYSSTIFDTYDVSTGKASKTLAVRPTYPSTDASQTTVAWDFLFVDRDATRSPLECAIQVANHSIDEVNGNYLKSNTRTIMIGNFLD